MNSILLLLLYLPNFIALVEGNCSEAFVAYS